MEFDVVLTDDARQDLSDILYDPASRFTEAQRLVYVEALGGICRGLETMPQRFARYPDDPSYRSVTHKAHRVVYRVDESRRRVFVVAIFHARMDIARRLRRRERR